MPHSSFQESFHLSTLPLLYLGDHFSTSCCSPLLAHLFNHQFLTLRWGYLVPEPLLPCCTWPVMSRCFKLTYPVVLHVLLVLKARTILVMQGSRESICVISSLTFEHLYSSTRLDTGSSRMPFPYGPILLMHLGTPNHFLTKELISLSIFFHF